MTACRRFRCAGQLLPCRLVAVGALALWIDGCDNRIIRTRLQKRCVFKHVAKPEYIGISPRLCPDIDIIACWRGAFWRVPRQLTGESLDAYALQGDAKK